MRRIITLFFCSSLLLTTAPLALAEETAETSNQGASAITNKMTGVCSGYTGAEQGQCLRRELRKRTLERKSSRRLQRSLRIAPTIQRTGQQRMIKTSQEESTTQFKLQNVGTKTRAVLKNIPTRRAQRRTVWENVQKRLRLRNAQKTEATEDEEKITEEDSSTEEVLTTSEKVMIRAKSSVKVQYQIRGRGRAKVRRYNLIQPTAEEEESADVVDVETEEENSGEEGESPQETEVEE